MPQNPFPDSLEKDTLRRRDAANLKAFKARLGSPGLSYCGLTCSEFRDVQLWRDSLSAVCAVENDPATRSDLHINWRRLRMSMPLNVVHGDIFEYLQAATTPCYDVYNIDLYGGFTYTRNGVMSPSRETIRHLASRHHREQRSFALIATFNVRDTGVNQYDSLLGEIKGCLQGLDGVDENLKEHGRSHASKIKLCYMYSCWHAGRTHDFEVEFVDPILYNSGKTTLVHFYGEFHVRNQALPMPYADQDLLIGITDLPLRRMKGRIPQVELRPTLILRPPAK